MSCTPSVVVNTSLAIGVEKVLTCLSALNNGYAVGNDFIFTIEAGNVYTITSATADWVNTVKFEIDDQIVIKTPDGVNDGTYTILTVNATVITVEEAVVDDEAQTGTTIHTEEVFKITPTRRMGQCCIMIYNTADAGDMTFSIAPGAFWAAGVALTGTINGNTAPDCGYTLLFVETALYLQADGTILLTLTPVASGRLVDTHTAEVCFVELP